MLWIMRCNLMVVIASWSSNSFWRVFISSWRVGISQGLDSLLIFGLIGVGLKSSATKVMMFLVTVA